MTPDFAADFEAFVRACRKSNHADNHDSYRFGPDRRRRTMMLERLAGAVVKGNKRRAVDTIRRMVDPVGAALAFVGQDLGKWRWLYAKLADAESRQTLVSVLAYRALGDRKVKLPLSNPDYWSRFKAAEAMADPSNTLESDGWRLTLFDLRSTGVPARLFARASGIVTQFMLQQYRCTTEDGREIAAAPGDVVIDGGACWGDTALYFANRVGAEGKVLAFEFLPDNLAVFERNVSMNPELGGRVRLVRNALWSAPGETLNVSSSGPGTRVSAAPEGSGESVQTATVDDATRDLASVDFIKMDIEGAELQALAGAEQTIRRHRPKLAICIYHRLSDFWNIPQFIDGLGCGYTFYIRHFTIHAEETILFAEPQPR